MDSARCVSFKTEILNDLLPSQSNNQKTLMSFIFWLISGLSWSQEVSKKGNYDHWPMLSVSTVVDADIIPINDQRRKQQNQINMMINFFAT